MSAMNCLLQAATCCVRLFAILRAHFAMQSPELAAAETEGEILLVKCIGKKSHRIQPDLQTQATIRPWLWLLQLSTRN
jgi:hypothetical protein